MVAPAGVNEGLPQEPAKAGRAGSGLAEAQAEPARAASADAGPDKAGRAKAASAEAAETTVPAGAVPPQAGPAAEERAAEPAEAGARQAGAVPAEAEQAVAAHAEAGQAGAAPAEAEQAGAAPGEGELGERAGGEPGESEAGERGWDEAEEARRDVSPLAVVGIIVGVIALVGVAVGVLAVVTHGFRPKTVITYRPAAAFGLRAGQCINSGPNALDVTVLSCARPHDAEVFATFGLPATAWPGASTVQADASGGCASRLGGYLNPDLATIDLAQEFIYPNQSAWQAGERTVVCEVRATSGRLTGSVRAKG
jgi:Septum formation